MSGRNGRDVAPDLRSFDGVVCFGAADWWTQDRGHDELVLMRELATRVRVLYVNGPAAGPPVARPLVRARAFVRRAVRVLRGAFRVHADFLVVTLPTLPGDLGPALARAALERATRRAGIGRPLAWVALPDAIHLLDTINPVAVVHQRAGSAAMRGGVDRAPVVEATARLSRHADLTLFDSRSLMRAESALCRRAAFVDAGFAGVGDVLGALERASLRPALMSPR